jgi:hypothetical protein
MGGKNKKSAQDCGAATQSQSSSPVPQGGQPVLPCQQKHWFGIRVVDEAGKVVKDVTAELLLTGGTQAVVDFSTETLEKDGTWRTQKVLESGQCVVSFPELYNLEWWPQGGSAGDFTVTQTATAAAGDCALSMADNWGFREYLSVWDRSKNKDLKARRPNPNQLLEGDELSAPDQKDKIVKKSTDQVWTFVVKTKKPAKLRLLLVDKDCKPLSGKDWELLSPVEGSGTTGADGLIEFKDIPLQETAASLKVKMSVPPPPLDPLEPLPPVVPTPYPPDVVATEFTDKDPNKKSDSHTVEWELKVGSLPTYNSSEGVRARLHNLGFGCDVEDEGDRSTRAVRAYQRYFLKNKSGSGVAKDIESDIRDRHDKAR